MHIGDGMEGQGDNAAHINLILDTREALGGAFASAAAR
jgi:formaldehyde-activating enzyme involved in methanogenesis